MKRLISLVVVAAVLALPAMAAAQTGSNVSANDDFRSDDSGLVGGDGSSVAATAGGGGGGAGGLAASAGDPSGSELAFTGLPLGLLAVAGLVLAASGAALRRVVDRLRSLATGRSKHNIL